jgi:aminoglycoside phosphotransferase (APT) family kinase protein
MTLTSDLVLQAVRRLGFTADSAQEATVGFTNTVYRAGDFAVRISREAEYEELHSLEAIVVPYAVKAGVRTPEILAVDETRSVIPMVFSVFPWVSGKTLGTQRMPLSRWTAVARDMGREAAKLHKLTELPDIEPAWWPNPEESIEILVEREVISPGEGTSLHNWAKRLAATVPDSEPVLTHNDLHPWNVLVEGGRMTAILDWANGGIGDPGLDFAGLPLELLPPMMAGYREVGDPPAFFEAAALRSWLGRALEEMTDTMPVAAYARSWQRWPEGGLAEVWLILQAGGPEWSVWSPE